MENQSQQQVTHQQQQQNANLQSQVQNQNSNQQQQQDQNINNNDNNPNNKQNSDSNNQDQNYQNTDNQNTNLQNNNLTTKNNVHVIEPIKVVKPPTPDEIELKPDTQTLQLLALIINRLRILERNIAVHDDELREEHLERESKLQQISTDINEMYEEYQQYMQGQENDMQVLEQKIKVEIDYNLIRIMENKLKMDREVYIMRKKLYERTVHMRELQVQVYNFKQEKKDFIQKVKDLESKVEEREKEIRRLQDIVYDVTTLNIKPNFALGSNQLSVPKFKNYDQYMITQQKEMQQQKYFMDNQTLKFGRQQNDVMTKDGIWQTQLMGGSNSNKNLLANTGKMLLQGNSGMRQSIDERRHHGGVIQTMSLNDILPDSWINNKYISTIEKPKFEDTFNERDSHLGQSSQKSQSLRSGNNQSPSNSDIHYQYKQYY